MDTLYVRINKTCYYENIGKIDILRYLLFTFIISIKKIMFDLI